MATDVLVLGMATVDFVLSVGTFPTEAMKYRAEAASTVGGGPAANAAVAIARLGGRPEVVARLGDDALGDLVLADLQSEGVSTRFVHRAAGGQSSFSSVLVDGAGERQIVNFRGAGLVEAVDWIDAVPRAGAVLCDTRWVAGAHHALSLARDWGVPGILDGEAPIDPALFDPASHLAFSMQGLISIDPDAAADPGEAIAGLARRTGSWVCVTDGEKGVHYTDGDTVAHQSAFPVGVVDTLGAGDVWHGAFALALSEGQPEPAAVRFACATAALKCTTFGGRKGTPKRAAVARFLQEHDT